MGDKIAFFKLEKDKAFIGLIEIQKNQLKELIQLLKEWADRKLKINPTLIGNSKDGIIVYTYDPLKDTKDPKFVELNPKNKFFIVIEKPKNKIKKLPNKIILNIKDTFKLFKMLKNAKYYDCFGFNPSIM